METTALSSLSKQGGAASAMERAWDASSVVNVPRAAAALSTLSCTALSDGKCGSVMMATSKTLPAVTRISRSQAGAAQPSLPLRSSRNAACRTSTDR